MKMKIVQVFDGYEMRMGMWVGMRRRTSSSRVVSAAAGGAGGGGSLLVFLLKCSALQLHILSRGRIG